jgi:demethoxyubiquinone hydroxylase (CLK1/Coq7/Cat5 family)
LNLFDKKAVTSTYEKLIEELEEENKSLINELSRYKSDPSNSNSDALLEESLQALNMMRIKVIDLLK